MRISDWSSDVCSSDLIGLGEDLVQCVAKVFYAHGRRAAVHGMPGSVQADELRVIGQALGKGDDLLSDLVLEADPCCLFPQADKRAKGRPLHEREVDSDNASLNRRDRKSTRLNSSH